MRRERLYPIVLGMISAIISFIAVVAIITRNFQLNIKWVILLGIIVAAVFYSLSYFRVKASIAIKRIAQEHHLTAEALAEITGLPETDFPIYNSKLQLIAPKRHWPHILNALHEYERTHKQENKL
ncbi:hypothetical protein FC62_GL001087 [Amylolactobacillus amylotrophicus DSM 20534]|uniref:Uncharacterized protein n=3 Tax=Amylolactobacillus TaxID=2767876 RepID=A0A0R1YGB4_9LACO|nr:MULTISPECIES: hypothetical protein [Amylolactobacillus]APT18679.1 hypothetical protein LA20533_05110 [Amylolactobacillus amylophilus DSM 20533 = JCM 1125]KRK37757.1 hypothetical protein FC62_GL001087 [Amylolactobacillus amylotrophicus DSM 20534]KRM41544.1 hypothetical protein FD40_GL001383 [Amylolactobacillus amylophilus DSM 20533 = JCM 1125]GED80774.1 hypothetical protein LAM01_12470 [Amylolactobacillus amylophilus]